MRALFGAWAGAMLVLLYCVAIGTSNASLFSNHVAKDVAILAAGGAFVGLVLGWFATPAKPDEKLRADWLHRADGESDDPKQ